MSKPLAKTKCPCGEEIVCEIKKPAYYTPTVSKLSCPYCDSRFLLICELAKSKPPFERNYTSRFEIIRLSEKATARAKNPIRQIASTVVERASKRDTDPNF